MSGTSQTSVRAAASCVPGSAAPPYMIWIAPNHSPFGRTASSAVSPVTVSFPSVRSLPSEAVKV